jgi:hypothetical protein
MFRPSDSLITASRRGSHLHDAEVEVYLEGGQIAYRPPLDQLVRLPRRREKVETTPRSVDPASTPMAVTDIGATGWPVRSSSPPRLSLTGRSGSLFCQTVDGNPASAGQTDEFERARKALQYLVFMKVTHYPSRSRLGDYGSPV